MFIDAGMTDDGSDMAVGIAEDSVLRSGFVYQVPEDVNISVLISRVMTMVSQNSTPEGNAPFIRSHFISGSVATLAVRDITRKSNPLLRDLSLAHAEVRVAYSHNGSDATVWPSDSWSVILVWNFGEFVRSCSVVCPPRVDRALFTILSGS